MTAYYTVRSGGMWLTGMKEDGSTSWSCDGKPLRVTLEVATELQELIHCEIVAVVEHV